MEHVCKILFCLKIRRPDGIELCEINLDISWHSTCKYNLFLHISWHSTFNCTVCIILLTFWCKMLRHWIIHARLGDWIAEMKFSEENMIHKALFTITLNIEFWTLNWILSQILKIISVLYRVHTIKHNIVFVFIILTLKKWLILTLRSVPSEEYFYNG